MKKKVSILISSAMVLLALGGCAAGGASSSSVPAASNSAQQAGKTLSINHALGDIEAPLAPQKVVVFDYGVLDTIDTLQVETQIAVPKDNMPGYLEKYKGDEFVSVGGVKEFDLEAVNEFQPELIIISTRQQDYYKELSEIAPTLFVEIDSKNYMEDFEKNTRIIGQIFEKSKEAEAALELLSGQVELAQEMAKKNAENALIILTNDGAMSVYGSGSRFGIIHDTFGVPMADENIEASTHGQEVNYEYIAEKNPDILFVVDRTIVIGGNNVASKTLDNELINGTNAAKNGRVVMLDADVWYLSGGGLRSVEKMITDIQGVFEK